MKKLALTAAALAVISAPALAADLPSRKAAPVNYVKICDVYGAGFYYIPGSNTCLKVGGRVRFEVEWRKTQDTFVPLGSASLGYWKTLSPVAASSVHAIALSGAGSAAPTSATAIATQDHLWITSKPKTYKGSGMDQTGWQARAYVNLDARTQTAYGTVQTVVGFYTRSRSGANQGSYTSVGGSTNAAPTLYAAYIRFAGFTFGRAPWVFPAGPGGTFYANVFSGGSPNGQLQATYTAIMGGGISATIGLVDRNDSSRSNTYGTFTNIIDVGNSVYWAANLPSSGIRPSRMPAVVATLRVDQGWGYAHLGGAIQQNRIVFGNDTATPLKASNNAWAVGASLKINTPQIAPGNALYLYAAYTSGMLDWVTSSNAQGSGSKEGLVMGGYGVAHPDLHVYTCGLATNSSASVNGGLTKAASKVCVQNVKALALMAAYTHFWSPTVRSNIAFSYAKFTPGSGAKSVDWFAYGGSPISSAWTINKQIVWSPTKGLDFGLEVYYSRANHKLACGDASNSGYSCPTFATKLLTAKRNGDDFVVKFRAERTF